ncbi:MAG: thiol peroxidase [Proteobacteria bacterium]|nr:MAG: thiol peroxidase [Pseudomonadota bacterium]
MSQVKFKNNPIHLNAEQPQVGQKAPDFQLTGTDLSEVSLDNFKGQRVVLNVAPSVDTDVCAQQLRTFNQKAADLDNTAVVFTSMDLPFAYKRFCAAEGIKNAVTASDYKNRSMAQNYGLEMRNGPLAGLTARAVFVLDENHKIIHREVVDEVTNEPNYEAALQALQK